MYSKDKILPNKSTEYELAVPIRIRPKAIRLYFKTWMTTSKKTKINLSDKQTNIGKHKNTKL